MMQDQQDETQWAPASNAVRSWRRIMSPQADALGRLLGGAAETETDATDVAPQDLEARARAAKLQRELALDDSQEARGSLQGAPHMMTCRCREPVTDRLTTNVLSGDTSSPRRDGDCFAALSRGSLP